jgi:pimeloyl-ACP methyl ester carboxylesterase
MMHPDLFDPVVVSTYDLPASSIPDSLIGAVQFDSDGNALHGFFVRQPDSLRVEPHHVIIYHHGNGQSIIDAWPRIDLLWRCGFSVFVYDYRGFGMCEGRSSSIAGLERDAEAACRTVFAMQGVDTTSVVQYGFDIGAIAALHVASRYACDAVIIESASAAGCLGRVNTVHRRLMILHGVEDRQRPIYRNGDLLYGRASAPKLYLRVERADHHTIPWVLGERTYIDHITTYIRGS